MIRILSTIAILAILITQTNAQQEAPGGPLGRAQQSLWTGSYSADGSYTYGDTEIAGGDQGSSFYSGGNSGHETGQWKTEKGVIFINEGYGWQSYAEYYVEGNSMLFTFSDGSKQLWERYR